MILICPVIFQDHVIKELYDFIDGTSSWKVRPLPSLVVIAAFLTHVGTRQLLKQMPTYTEKKHYHVGKKITDVGFV